MPSAYLVKTGIAAWYFVDGDMRVYSGKKAAKDRFAGLLIGSTYDRDQISGGEYVNGEIHFNTAPFNLEMESSEDLDEIVQLHAFLVLKNGAGCRVTDMILNRELKPPSRKCKVN